MDRSQFSVSWEAHQKSICSGLSGLQQRGEFVDMTLAADGHHVRVHKMVMSLVSPYIKELINTADCTHPVIFLNQMSYRTLCSILEYVYTGEVLVPRDNINEFIAAGKALHIRGLINMQFANYLTRDPGYIQVNNTEANSITPVTEGIEDVSANNTNMNEPQEEPRQERLHEVFITEDLTVDNSMDQTFNDILISKVDLQNRREKQREYPPTERESDPPSRKTESTTDPSKTPDIQYTVSNQGNLQMVLNRYMYYLVYTGRSSGHRRWQCIDNHMKRLKCPAAVITKNGNIVQRISAHNHTFHDEKILKKVQAGAIFSALKAAQNLGKTMHDERNAAKSSTSNDRNEDSDNK